MVNRGRFDSSTFWIGLNKVFPNRVKGSSISLLRFIKPKSNLGKKDPSLFIAGAIFPKSIAISNNYILSAGVGRTGVFITLSHLLERLQNEGVIDPFSVIRTLRTQRPAMVQTEYQYQFCYRAALEYISTFDYNS